MGYRVKTMLLFGVIATILCFVAAFFGLLTFLHPLWVTYKPSTGTVPQSTYYNYYRGLFCVCRSSNQESNAGPSTFSTPCMSNKNCWSLQLTPDRVLFNPTTAQKADRKIADYRRTHIAMHFIGFLCALVAAIAFIIGALVLWVFNKNRHPMYIRLLMIICGCICFVGCLALIIGFIVFHVELEYLVVYTNDANLHSNRTFSWMYYLTWLWWIILLIAGILFMIAVACCYFTAPKSEFFYGTGSKIMEPASHTTVTTVRSEPTVFVNKEFTSSSSSSTSSSSTSRSSSGPRRIRTSQPHIHVVRSVSPHRHHHHHHHHRHHVHRSPAKINKI